MSLGVVILAAGESARMGVPKQLLEYRGTTLLQHAIATANFPGVSCTAIVLGAHAEKIRSQLGSTDAAVVENSGWREGMAGSVRVGLNALLAVEPGLSVVIFMLCDQPLISSDALKLLASTHERTGAPIVASEYEGTLGVPALFARSMFPELLALEGAAGARKVIQDHRNIARGVPLGGAFLDVDTPADYARLRDSFTHPTALTV